MRRGSYIGGGTIIGFAARRAGDWTDRRAIPRHQRKRKPKPPPPLPGPKWKLVIEGRKRRQRAASAVPGRTIPWVKGRPATDYELALYDHLQARHAAQLAGEAVPKVPPIVARKLGSHTDRVLALLLRRHFPLA